MPRVSELLPLRPPETSGTFTVTVTCGLMQANGQLPISVVGAARYLAPPGLLILWLSSVSPMNADVPAPQNQISSWWRDRTQAEIASA